MSACGPNGSGGGAGFSSPSTTKTAEFTQVTQGSSSAGVDTSHVSEGYVGAIATNGNILKFQVVGNGVTNTYDLPSDGTPLIAPLSHGNGSYTFKIMQNTSGNRYVELFSCSVSVKLESEFAPFLVPSVYCNYTASSSCVAQAKSLTSGVTNQGEAAGAILEWIEKNIRYDNQKAAELSTGSGYVPNPDSTIASKTGVCFDYASLTAAMLRSQGIPCKIVTGYVSNNIYHAWNMIYIDGTWKTVSFELKGNQWELVDTTLAASGPGATIGDGGTYIERYVY
ncbi:MAG: transglutaminase family protein [Anaerotardibacter sp.]